MKKTTNTSRNKNIIVFFFSSFSTSGIQVDQIKFIGWKSEKFKSGLFNQMFDLNIYLIVFGKSYPWFN